MIFVDVGDAARLPCNNTDFQFSPKILDIEIFHSACSGVVVNVLGARLGNVCQHYVPCDTFSVFSSGLWARNLLSSCSVVLFSAARIQSDDDVVYVARFARTTAHKNNTT